MKIINLGTKELASFYVACELFKQMDEYPNSNLGLATGGTMTNVYEHLVSLLKKNQLDVSKITTFNLDEYVGLEPEHNQSYHYYMNQILFNQYPYFNRQNIHIPNGDVSNLDEEVKRYNQIIKSEGPIDVQLLGIGENGHIGFNEPGTDFDSETHVVDLTESTIKANSRYFNHESEVPKQAVSMGLQSIIKAERIILLAFGEKKRQAINNLLTQPISEDIPSTILKTHANVEIYVDDAAAPDVD